MAKSKNNIIMRNTSGAIGKQIVFKVINGETIAAKYPDMSQVEYNKEQLKYRQLFAEGVRYAKEILYTPAIKQNYERKIRKSKTPEMSVYHFALKEFMAKHSRKVPKSTVETLLQKYLQAYTFSDRERIALKHLIKSGSLTNAIFQRINDVSKATATRDLQAMVAKRMITPPVTKGAGAVYTLVALDQKK